MKKIILFLIISLIANDSFAALKAVSTSGSGGGGAISSVTSGSNDIVVSPTTGAVVVSATDIINAQGTAATYTILSSDMGKTVTHNKATSVAVTLPQAGSTGFLAGVSFNDINLGAGTVTITPTTSTINGATTLALTQGQSAYIISDGTNWVAFQGAGSGGGAVSSVSNSDSTLTITPTTGAVVGSLNLAHANTWTAGQAVTPSTISISTSTFTPNLALSNNFNMTLVHASCPCTLANPTNIVPGQSGVIVINQSSTGSDLINTYGSDYVFTNGAAPTLSTAANAVDELSYYVVDSTHIRISPVVSTSQGSPYQVSFQPGLLTAVNNTTGGFGKISKASTVDNITASATSFTCTGNPTVTMYECGTSATCATPTTIGSATVTTSGTAVNGSVSSASITAGDYIAWAVSSGTCTSLDISATAQIHTN